MFSKIHSQYLRRATTLALLVFMLCNYSSVFGAKGGAKAKKGYVLRFNGFDANNMYQPHFLTAPNIMYKGSFNQVDRGQQQTTINSIITFQKGNTIFIYPYKHKVKVPYFKTPQKTPL
jgi:hypothetical protein